MIRAATLLLLGAAAARAQYWDITAPVRDLIYGQSVRLSAEVRDSSGAIFDGAPLQWTSSDASVIAVDSGGQVTALALGTAAIRVTSAKTVGTFGELEFQVLPSGIQISPASQDVAVGGTLPFTGAAYDINGAAIPNASFQWEVTAENGVAAPVAKIDSNGLFTAMSTGLVTVHGYIAYAPREGKLARYESFVPIRIRLAPAYRTSRLLGNDAARNAFVLRASPGSFAANDRGDIAFTASLDALSTGAFLLSGGALKLLANTGTPSPFPGGVVGGIQSMSMNAAGQVLVTIPSNPKRIDGAALIGDRDQVSYRLLEGTNPSAFENNIRYLTVTPNSLNDNGDFLYFALYTDPDGADHNGLFYFARSTSRLLWSSEQSLPGVPAPINFVLDYPANPSWNGPNGFGMDNALNFYFLAQTGFNTSNRTLFRMPLGGTPVKVLAINDDFLKSKVKVLTDVNVLSSGDLVMRVDLINGQQHVIRMSGANVDDLPVRSSPLLKVFGGSAGGVVFLGNPTGTSGKGDGLYVWKNGTATQVLALNGPAPNGETIASIEGAAVTSDGRVIAVVRTSANDFVVLQAPGAALVRVGTPFQGSASLFFRGLVNGRRSGNPFVLTGNPSSLFELQGSALAGRVALDDPLPGGNRFEGFGGAVEDPSGAVVFGALGGLYRYSNGAVSMLLNDNTQASDGTRLLRPKPWAVNGTGSVVVETDTSTSKPRLFLLKSGKLTQLLAFGSKSPLDGGTVTGWTEAAVDDQDRVMVNVQTAGGGSGYFLFTGSTAQGAAILGALSLGGRAIAAIGGLRASRNDFYALFSRVPFGDSSVVRFAAARSWTALVNTGDPVLNGAILSYIDAFDVNSSGSVVIAAQVQGTGSRIIAAPSAGGLKVVYLNSDPTDDGDYLLRFSDLNIRDDGRVLFLGFDVFDRALIYQASPTG